MFKLFKLSKALWWQLLLVFLFVAIQTVLQLYLTKFTEIITNSLSEGQIVNNQLILDTGLKMIGIALLILLAALAQMVTNASLMASFGKIIRSKLFSKVQNYSVSNLNSIGTSSLLTRVNSDTRQLQTFLFMLTRTVVMAPTFMIVGSIMLFQTDPMYTYIILIGMPIIVLIIGVSFRYAAPLFKVVQDRLDYVTLLFREGLTGVRVVRAFNQQKREYKFFNKANRDMADTTNKVGRIMEFVNPCVTIIFNTAYVSVYIVGLIIFEKGGNPENDGILSQIITSGVIVNMIMMSFLMLSFIFVMFPRSAASAKRIVEALELEPEIKNRELSSGIVNARENGSVEFKNVIFTYTGTSHPTLVDINFKTKPGEVTAIIGSTGSGKSSLINLLPRFFDVTAGEVLINNINVKDYDLATLRDNIGFVPQQAVLFSGTVRDNLRFGKKDASDEEMIEALKVAQSWSFLQTKQGLDTRVAQGAKNFSGGQKQRLSIARALVRKPNVYVFDDSFSALDFKTDIKLRKALSDYAKSSSIIIVAQRVSSIINANQIVVLDEGKVAGIGKHNDLLKTCKVYQEIVRSQMDQDEIEKTVLLQQEVVSTKGGN